MALLKSIYKLLFKDKEQSILQDSIVVISSYGEVMEQYAGYSKAPMTKLPTTKNKIIESVNYLIEASKKSGFKERLSKFLSNEQVDHITSPKFNETLVAGLVLLETFVPDEEAEKEMQKTNKLQEMIEEFERR